MASQPGDALGCGLEVKGLMALSSCLPIRGLGFLRAYGFSVSGGDPRLAASAFRLVMIGEASSAK